MVDAPIRGAEGVVFGRTGDSPPNTGGEVSVTLTVKTGDMTAVIQAGTR
jgi:hypothetical protein